MLLTDEFIEQYKNKKPPMTPIGEFVYYRTYSRFLPELNRREYWYETCRRAVEYNCSLVENVSKDEAEQLFDYMFNLKLFLSGRTLWVGGTESSKKYPSSNFNCSYTNIEKIDDICEVFYLLMLGCGVGFKAIQEHVDKFPIFNKNIKIIHKTYEELKEKKEHSELNFSINGIYYKADIIVGDSKEGWVEALRYLFGCLQRDGLKEIYINYDNIRPEGSPLKTFGGYASGPKPLQEMFEKIVNIIKNTDNGKLKTIDILDICNLLGQAVQVGGVRRSAEICLFDKDDNDIRNAKQNLKPDLYHRFSSNNSILFNEKPSYQELKEIFETIKTTGEPGFINGEQAKKRFADFSGINPCFTGDMKLLTDNGYVPLQELEGKDFNIISKDGTISKGKVWCSGEKQIFAIKRANQDDIKCTDNHVFMLNDGSECEAKNLKGKRLMPFLNHKKTHSIEYVKYGFIQGDGGLGRLNSNTHKGLEINIGNKDKDVLQIFGLEDKNCRSYYISGYNEELKKLGFCSNDLPDRIFPLTYKNWNREQKLSFLSGCYSANGSILSCGRITYKTTCKAFAEQLILALNEFNINAYMTVNKAKKVEFNNGIYNCKESYDINIQKYSDRVKFYNLIGFIQAYKNEKLKNILIEQSPMVQNVINLNKIEKVYDFTEPNAHWGVINGFIAHNCAEILLPSKGFCNLVEVNTKAFATENGFNVDIFNALKLATRASYRMACVNIELPEWNKIQENNMLLGVSLSGWQDAMNICKFNDDTKCFTLAGFRMYIHETCKYYSKELGRNESKLLTTVKPSGTLSLLPTVSPGVHYSHSPYYIRRVRINSGDPLVKVCEELGLKVVPEVGQTEENCTTKVVEFYIKAPEGKTKENVSAIEQLETYKMFMDYYVDHNTSITVTVKEDEWDSVVDWVYNNWDSFVGISFLPHYGGTYQLAPYESITEEEYNKNFKEITITPELISKYENTYIQDDDLGSECDGGSCPIR